MKTESNGNRIHKIEKYFFSQGKNYLTKRLEDLVEIKESLMNINDTHCLKKIQNIGHKIKGSAGLYGFSKLSEIGLHLEIAAKNGDVSRLPNVVDEFQSFLNEANIK